LRDQWNSRIGFILASIGSAVGLGNIWRFPTVTAENGGGAFLFVYLIVVLIIGVPVMIIELTLGRKSQTNVVSTFDTLTNHPFWSKIGFIGLISALVVLSFYAVIAGWVILYFFFALVGRLSLTSANDLLVFFDTMIAHPYLSTLGLIIFLTFTLLIVMTGVSKGIERFSKFSMPSVIILLIILFARTITLEGSFEGLIWFLSPRLEDVTLSVALNAIGQVFFSFSLGMGILLTYGSYLAKDTNIPSNSLIISISDVLVAILAGAIVIPALFAFNLELETGPGLIFVTIPAVFNTLPLGSLWTSVFFLLLAFAALTSSVSFLEVLTAYTVDKFKQPRKNATILATFSVFILGLPSALAAGPLDFFTVRGMNFLDLVDTFSSTVLLPLSGLLIVLFTGWVWGNKTAIKEIQQGAPAFNEENLIASLWSILVKYLIPLAILYIFITGFLAG